MEKTLIKSFFEILRSTSLTLIGRIISAFLGLTVSIIIARIYGPDMTGFLGIIGASALLFAYPAAAGLHVAILRFIPEYKVKYLNYPVKRIFNYVISFVLLMSLVSSFIFLSLEFIWSDFIKVDNLEVANLSFVICIIIILKAALLVALNALRAFEFDKLFAFFQLFTPLVNLIGLLILIPIIGELSPIYALILSFLIPFVFSVVFINRHETSIRGRGSYHSIDFRSLLKVSFPIMIGGYIGVLASNFGVVFLGASINVTEVGLYVVALKLSYISSMVIKAVNAVIAPKISKMYFSGNIDKMFILCRLFTCVSSIFALIIFLIFFFCGEFLLAVGYGDEFVGAAPILIILLMAQLVNAITGSSGELMQMTDSEKKYMNIQIYGAIVYILSGIVLIPYIGALGLAIAFLFAEIVWNGVALIFIFRKFKQLPLIKIIEFREFIRLYGINKNAPRELNKTLDD